jgi:NADPH2:quinone reductase
MTPTTRSDMQALVFERAAIDASASRVIGVPIPSPGVGELSIAVEFAGINFKDVMSRRGDAGYVPRWPFVPGLEVAGTIRALGAGVDSWEVGQRVVALTNAGGLAEVAVARAELTVGVPEQVELRSAAAVPGALTTAVLLLDTVARLRSGDVVLVHSASGAVGRAVAQLAQLQGGVQLIGCVGAPSRIEAGRRGGYETVIVRSEHLVKDVRAHLSGRGVDVVLDPQGTTLLDQDLEVLAPGGRIVLFGNASGTQLQGLPPPARLFAANASLGGFSLAALSVTAPHKVASAMTTVLDHLTSGEITVEGTLVEGLENAPAAQQALAEGTGVGKYVVHLAR